MIDKHWHVGGSLGYRLHVLAETLTGWANNSTPLTREHIEDVHRQLRTLTDDVATVLNAED